MSGKAWYSQREFLGAAEYRRRELDAEIKKAEGLLHVHHERRSALERQHVEALNALAHALLPTFSRDAVDRARMLVGAGPYPPGQHPADRMEAERRDHQARLPAILGDRRFVERHVAIDPKNGTLVRMLHDVSMRRAPTDEFLRRMSHPRLEELVRCGYGTPAYDVGFWRLSYYQNRSAAAEILERFPGRSFAELRDRYLTALSERSPLLAEEARIRSEIAATEALVAEHRARISALETLENRHRVDAQRALVEFVMRAPPELMGPRLEQAPHIVAIYKKASGLQSQIGYLDAMMQSKVFAERNAMIEAKSALEREMAKVAHPRHAGRRFPAPQFEKRFKDRRAHYAQRWQRVERDYARVHGFSHYEHAHFHEQFLWWHLMTAGRVNGSYIPEVSRFETTHPDYVWSKEEREPSGYPAVDDGRYEDGSPATGIAGDSDARDVS